LTLQGEVLVDIAVEPRAVQFGEKRKDERETKTFSVKVSEPDRVKVTSVTLQDEKHFRLTRKSGQADGSAEYEIAYLGAAKLGRIATKVVVAYQGSEASTKDMPVYAEVVGDVRARPSRLHFVKVNDKYKPRELTLTSRSGKPVEVLGFDDKGGKLKVETLTPKGEKAVLRLSVADPAAKADSKEKYELVIKVRSADSPEIAIPYTVSDRRRRGPLNRDRLSAIRPVNRPKPPAKPEKK